MYVLYYKINKILFLPVCAFTSLLSQNFLRGGIQTKWLLPCPSILQQRSSLLCRDPERVQILHLSERWGSRRSRGVSSYRSDGWSQVSERSDRGFVSSCCPSQLCGAERWARLLEIVPKACHTKLKYCSSESPVLVSLVLCRLTGEQKLH